MSGRSGAMARAARWRRAAAPALLLALAGAGYLLLRDLDAVATLRAHGMAARAWAEANPAASIALYVLCFAGVVVLSLPGAFAMTLAGGFLFGPVPGTALAVGSATVGALAIFLAARSGFGEAVRRWLLARGADGSFARLERGLREDATTYLLLLRLVPAVPFPVANVAPAFFGVRARTFALTTFFGIMPGTALTAWIGHGIGTASERPDLDLLREPAVFGPLLALVLLLALPLVARRLRRP